MNNNEMRFDPNTGLPLTENPIPDQNIDQVLNQTSINQGNINTNTDSNIGSQELLSKVPTVEQNTNEFISNVQSSTAAAPKTKKDNSNTIFVIVLFAVIILSILFLFPYVFKNL